MIHVANAFNWHRVINIFALVIGSLIIVWSGSVCLAREVAGGPLPLSVPKYYHLKGRQRICQQVNHQVNRLHRILHKKIKKVPETFSYLNINLLRRLFLKTFSCFNWFRFFKCSLLKSAIRLVLLKLVALNYHLNSNFQNVKRSCQLLCIVLITNHKPVNPALSWHILPRSGCTFMSSYFHILFFDRCIKLI